MTEILAEGSGTVAIPMPEADTQNEGSEYESAGSPRTEEAYKSITSSQGGASASRASHSRQEFLEAFTEEPARQAPSSASSARQEPQIAEFPMPTSRRPHAVSMAGNMPAYRVSTLSIQTFSPGMLADGVVRPEQLPQLRNAQSMKRATSMAARSGLTRTASDAPRLIPAANKELLLSQLARSSQGGYLQNQFTGTVTIMSPRTSEANATSPSSPTRAQLASLGISNLVEYPTAMPSSRGKLGTPRKSVGYLGNVSAGDVSNAQTPLSKLAPSRSQSGAVAPPGAQNRVTQSGLAASSASTSGAAPRPSQPQVPDHYVPAGLAGVELHVPLHLVAHGQDAVVQDMPAFMLEGHQPSTGGASGDTSRKRQGPQKLLGGLALPFAERTHAMVGPRSAGKRGTGNVLKTTNRGHDKTVSKEASMSDAQHLSDQLVAAKEMGADLQVLNLQDLISVTGIHSRDAAYHSQLQTKPRTKRAGRINFKNLRPLPSAITAGALGVPVERVQQALTRRVLATEQNMYGPPVFQRKYSQPPATPEGIQLDGFVLLEAGDDEMPEGIVAARVSGRHINSVEEADLPYFSGLRVLDLSDNRMPSMQPLWPLEALQALSLSLNHMTQVGDWDPTSTFQSLVTLDLSYNKLSAEFCLGTTSNLAQLPCLRELNLSGNELHTLPKVLGPFFSLELLKLAENHLTGDALIPLSSLPALQSLNISKNPEFQGLIGGESQSTAGIAHDDTFIWSSSRLDPAQAFPALRTLDASNCSITKMAAVQPLKALPQLKQLILTGNPLALAAVQAQKRDIQKKERAALLAADGAILPPGALNDPEVDPLFVWQPPASNFTKPTVAKVLTGNGGRFLAISEPLGRRDAERAAAIAATAAVPEEAVGAAFERVDAMMEAWQLNTVPEGDEDEEPHEEEEEEDEEEEDGEPVEDNTFLTGVGITEKPLKPTRSLPIKLSEVPAPDKPVWEDVSDPTERLALALGLEPQRLAIYTGLPTKDALGSINALRFALSHPLVEADEGTAAAPTYMAMTANAKAKRCSRPVKLEPMKGSASVPYPPSIRTMKVQTVENMLTAMRSRLATLEGKLTQQLSSIPATAPYQPPQVALTHSQSLQGSKPTSPGGLSIISDMEVGADGDFRIPATPQTPECETSPFKTRVLDDAASDVSALPDDVMAAIENSDVESEKGMHASEDGDEYDGLYSPPTSPGKTTKLQSEPGLGPLTPFSNTAGWQGAASMHVTPRVTLTQQQLASHAQMLGYS